MSFLDRTACAEGALWRGQEKSAARIGNTRKIFEESTTQKTPALKGLRSGGRLLCRGARTMSPHRPSRRSWYSPRQNATQAASSRKDKL
jgi:hypothetical protein